MRITTGNDYTTDVEYTIYHIKITYSGEDIRFYPVIEIPDLFPVMFGWMLSDWDEELEKPINHRIYMGTLDPSGAALSQAEVEIPVETTPLVLTNNDTGEVYEYLYDTEVFITSNIKLFLDSEASREYAVTVADEHPSLSIKSLKVPKRLLKSYSGNLICVGDTKFLQGDYIDLVHDRNIYADNSTVVIQNLLIPEEIYRYNLLAGKDPGCIDIYLTSSSTYTDLPILVSALPEYVNENGEPVQSKLVPYIIIETEPGVWQFNCLSLYTDDPNYLTYGDRSLIKKILVHKSLLTYHDYIPEDSNLEWYGIEWNSDNPSTECKRIGNLELHKTLPILNNIRLCLGDDLNKLLEQVEGTLYLTYSSPSIGAVNFKQYLHYEYDPENNKDNIKTFDLLTTYGDVLVGRKCVLQSRLNPYTKYTGFSIYKKDDGSYGVNHNGTIPTGEFSLYVETYTNGIDGEILAYIPGFYYKCYSNSKTKQVRISEVPLAGYKYSPEFFIGAYRALQLKVVPENAGYLSGRKLGQLLSVANTENYMNIGDIEDVDEDGNPIFGVPIKLSQSSVINYSNDGYKILQYNQLKALYWLVAIEYANFDNLLPYIEELTPEGFKQGGLGTGICGSINNLGYYRSCVNGYMDGEPLTSAKDYFVLDGKPMGLATRYRGIENLFGGDWCGVLGASGVENSGFSIDNEDGTVSYFPPFDYVEGNVQEFILGEYADIIPKKCNDTLPLGYKKIYGEYLGWRGGNCTAFGGNFRMYSGIGIGACKPFSDSSTLNWRLASYN